ncbi:MAG: oligosaccharide flippase family protein [Candidatus Marinimicrobia bacterium]|nr:oligosaccharide flippase family protein [Candidatus Neomarinimicrobiota bacterium]
MSLYKNSSIYIISTFLLKGVTFLLLPVYSYLIEPAEFGIIFIVQLTASFMTAFLSLSLWSSISRFYFDTESESEISSMYSTMVYFLTIYVVAVYTLVFFNIDNLAQLLEVPIIYVRLGVIISLLDIFLPHLIALLRAREKAKKVAIIRTSLGILGLIIQVIFVITFEDKAAGFLSAKLITAGLCFLSFWVFSVKYLTFKVGLDKLWEYLKYSLHSLPGDIATWLVNFADRFMVKKYCGTAATGIYSVGYKLGQGQNLLQNSVNEAYVPYVFARYSNLKKHNRDLDKKALELFGLFTLIAAVSIVFIKDVSMLFEKNYRALATFFPLVAMAYLINGYKLIFHNPLAYNKKYMKYKSLIWIFAAGLNIGLNLILIRSYGYIGAAIATLAAYLVTFGVILLLINKAVPVKYATKKFIKIFLVSILYGSLYLLDFSLLNIFIKVVLSIFYIYIILRLAGLVTLLNNLLKRWLNGIFIN